MKMIKIEMSFATFEEAAAVLAKINSAATPDKPITVKATLPKTEEVKAAVNAMNTSKIETLAADSPQPSPAEAGNATTSSEKPDESPAAGAADECSYDDLKKSIMKLVAIDPKHMREIADSFGVKTFQGTAADVWPKAKKAVDDKIVELRG